MGKIINSLFANDQIYLVVFELISIMAGDPPSQRLQIMLSDPILGDFDHLATDFIQFMASTSNEVSQHNELNNSFFDDPNRRIAAISAFWKLVDADLQGKYLYESLVFKSHGIFSKSTTKENLVLHAKHSQIVNDIIESHKRVRESRIPTDERSTIQDSRTQGLDAGENRHTITLDAQERVSMRLGQLIQLTLSNASNEELRIFFQDWSIALSLWKANEAYNHGYPFLAECLLYCLMYETAFTEAPAENTSKNTPYLIFEKVTGFSVSEYFQIILE